MPVANPNRSGMGGVNHYILVEVENLSPQLAPAYEKGPLQFWHCRDILQQGISTTDLSLTLVAMVHHESHKLLISSLSQGF
ncbi:hypothetical protein SBF1_8020004 [Candidatus Desulfosporosinus infrequens]|uniref:Uncharacterized protein n=1 Tax=Candidatus Desulfosporosinus infrequens TaxID=2043169 RepID=A0A2U3LTG3_9FIRM|nr:hypothetical protein SBF1_8020004 [Candidatus Desulfosporosinus infrequens]